MAQGAESRRAVRASVPRGELYAYAPSTWRSLCNVFSDDGKPLSRTVRVHVTRSGQSEDLAITRLPCGVWWRRGPSVAWVGSSPTQCNGALRFRFGSQGASRTLVCDLASGEYQIPSCEHLYVDCARYTPGYEEYEIEALGLGADVEVHAEISDGTAQDFSPMTVTAPSSWNLQEDNWQRNWVCAPVGAYAFEVYPESALLDPSNRFEISAPGAIRDFGAGVCIPGSPLPIVSEVIDIACNAGDPKPLALVFFVR